METWGGSGVVRFRPGVLGGGGTKEDEVAGTQAKAFSLLLA